MVYYCIQLFHVIISTRRRIMARPKSEASEIAFNTIRTKINRFELAPGDKVSDLALSKELNMSRTPIREAMQQLEKSGLIIKLQNCCIVAPITEKDVNEILVSRGALEKCAAQYIIENGGISSIDKDNIESILLKEQEYLKDGRFFESFSEDTLFHATIVSLSGNSRLIEFMHTLNIQGDRLRWLSIMVPSRFDSTLTEHYNILNSISSGDVAEASKCIDLHIRNSYENYLNMLSDPTWNMKIAELRREMYA